MAHAMKRKLGLSKLGVIRDNKSNASLMRRSRHFYDAFETKPQTCFVSRLIENDSFHQRNRGRRRGGKLVKKTRISEHSSKIKFDMYL